MSWPVGARPRSIRVIVLAGAIALMAPGVWGHSVTIVEFGHLPSGLAAWQRHSFGIYRVCGPLSKLLYSLPAYLAGVRVDYPTSFDADVQGRPEWQLGLAFQEQHRSEYLSIFRWSRVLPLLVTLLGGCLICEWSTRLFGAWPGVASLCVWCWTPLVLGHGSLITSDVISAVTLLLAARTFWAFLLEPGTGTAIPAGLALGAALATKFTLLVLYPCWALILIGRVVQVRAHGTTGWSGACGADRTGPPPADSGGDPGPRTCGRSARPPRCVSPRRLLATGLLVFLISLIVVDGLYFVEGTGFRLSELKDCRSSQLRDLGRLGERPGFARIARVPWPIPREWVRGVDFQLAESDREEPAYLLGETCLGGWWYWYPVAAIIKLPLPALAIFALALSRIADPMRGSDPVFWAALCSLLPAAQAALVIMAATGTGTNAAFRYLIPSFSLLCVWAALAWRGPGRARFVATASLLWLALNALSACPDHLSWQNELGWAWDRWSGRPALIGDSLDWGQDLARLGAWVSRHSGHGSTVICVFGQGEGEPYGLDAPAARPASEPWEDSAYLAVSVNGLYGYAASQCVRVRGRYRPLTPEQCASLLGREPFDRVGRTIRIYRIRSPAPTP